MSFPTRARLAGPLTSVLAVATLSAQPPPTLPPVPFPPANQYSLAKANLGKTIFWDEQLSATGTVACATCHTPAAGGSDLRSLIPNHPGADRVLGTPDDVGGSPGVIWNEADGTYRRSPLFPMRAQVTSRKAPSVLMAAYSPLQFWDGRAIGRFDDPVTQATVIQAGGSLESQATGPILNTDEMAHFGVSWASVTARLTNARPLALASDLPVALASWLQGRSYPQLFQEAFGTPEVTAARICLAVATYERTLVPNQAPIDAFLAGNQQALTPGQARGFQVFNGPARCVQCHAAPIFARPDFFNIGVRPLGEDHGRFAITSAPIDDGAFKVPSLRNVAQRAPFFHNGRFRTIPEVVDFYMRGGDFHQNQTPLIQPFQIPPMDRNALIDFLTNALVDPRVAQRTAPFDHPTLYAGGPRAPRGYGIGSAGSGALVPRLFAVDPPVLGNARFAIGLGDVLGGARALLALDLAPDTLARFLGNVPIQLGLTAALQIVDLGTTPGSGPGNGHATLVVAIPAEASLAGLPLYAQSLVLDAGAPYGLAGTAGVEVTLFGAR